jgi:hypothetical protein
MQVYTHIVAVLISALLTLVPGLGAWLKGTDSAQVQTEETIRRTLSWASATGTGRVLELSNLHGRVVIIGEDRADVAVVATRTVERRGRPSDALPQTDLRQAGDRVLLCGDAGRCGCHSDTPRGERRRWDERPQVRVDFEVRVPRAVTLDVCAINAEVVRVEGTHGPYTLRNVNGDVEMRGVGGHGEARTVNGDIDASFPAAPTGPGRFSSVNGDLDVTMPAGLAADVRMRTMHGGLFTDFDTAPLPRRGVAPERRGGRTIYRQDGHAAVRVGGGGPELTFETLNGDIRLRRPTQQGR